MYYLYVHFKEIAIDFDYYSVDPEGVIKQDRQKITATIGLVVHAAGKKWFLFYLFIFFF